MDQTAAPIDAPLTIDHPCIKCGYSLRGLRTSAKCPECATPVERSLRGDMLVYSDDAYLARLLRGTQLILGSILGIVVLGVVTFAVASAKLADAGKVMTFGQLLAWLAFLIGWWMLTEPDPGQLSSNKGEGPRKLARWALLADGCFSLASVIAQVALAADTPVLMLIGAANYVAMAVGFYSGMLYIRWLSPRIPNLKAARRARTLMILIAVILAFYIGIALAAFASRAPTTGPRPVAAPFAILGILGLIAGVLGLAALVMYYNLFSWLRKDFLRIRETQQLSEAAGVQLPASH